jgi:hypothetical protein
MNFLRLSLAVIALILTLAIPAFAGEIHTPIAPPPEAGEMETGAAATGDISCLGVSDPLTEIALSFVQNMLSLF